MSNLENLLSRLDRVRRFGKHYRSRCPACNSHRADTLSIRETDDGRVLLHCFAGCDAASVLSAVGLTLADVMPPRDTTTSDGRRQIRESVQMAEWAAALSALNSDLYILEVALSHHDRLQEAELKRVHDVINRIRETAAYLRAENRTINARINHQRVHNATKQ